MLYRLIKHEFGLKYYLIEFRYFGSHYYGNRNCGEVAAESCDEDDDGGIPTEAAEVEGLEIAEALCEIMSQLGNSGFKPEAVKQDNE